MKKIIALLLVGILLVVGASGCLTTTPLTSGGGNASNPLAGAFQGAGSEDVGAPPSMPELPG